MSSASTNPKRWTWLKREAALFSQVQRFGLVEAEDMDNCQPDDARHVITVIVQLVESSDPARLEIGADAVDHLEKILMRDAIARDAIGERGPNRMIARASCEGSLQIRPPARDRSGPVSNVFAVAKIVAVPHEGVNCAHRAPLRPGQ